MTPRAVDLKIDRCISSKAALVFSQLYDPSKILEALRRGRQARAEEVRAAVSARARTLHAASALLSPAAGGMLEELAQVAQRATIERFGRTIAMFAPLYLSNECVCTCAYCGFSMGLDIKRRTLRVDEVAREARLLSERGVRNILLVSAEHPKRVSIDYVCACVRETKRRAPYVAVEIAATEEQAYRAYVDAGCDGVVLYQETYDPSAYAAHHLGGPKRQYLWRLDAPERASRAGAKHLGIGSLLGLADWRFEALSLLEHARYLERRCWRSQLNVSLPRINPAEGGYVPVHPVSDRDLVHLMIFLRIALPTAGIVLSTRERPALRDRLVALGVTHLSAGSSTVPGGYAEPGAAGEQFALEDMRPPHEVAARLRELGYDPIFKDWEIMAPSAEPARVVAK